jgi:hypothetical protein
MTRAYTTTQLLPLSLTGLQSIGHLSTATLELIDGKNGIRGLLHAATAAGLDLLFAPGPCDSIVVALLVNDGARAKLGKLPGVARCSGLVPVSVAEVLPTLRSALVLWLRHVLEHAPHPSGGGARAFLPIEDGLMLDAAELSADPAATRGPHEVCCALELDVAADRRDDQHLADFFLSVRVEGRSCRPGSRGFSPLHLLCDEARAEYLRSGLVDLRENCWWQTYLDPESTRHRSTIARLLPSMEEVRVLRFCSEPRALSADALGTAEAEAEGGAHEVQHLWGEVHGLWLPTPLAPYCTVAPVDGLGGWRIVPAGALWPLSGAQPAHRASRVPMHATLGRLRALLASQRVLGGCTLRVKLPDVAAAVPRQPQLYGGFQKASELAARPALPATAASSPPRLPKRAAPARTPATVRTASAPAAPNRMATTTSMSTPAPKPTPVPAPKPRRTPAAAL